MKKAISNLLLSLAMLFLNFNVPQQENLQVKQSNTVHICIVGTLWLFISTVFRLRIFEALGLFY
ncbi:MAG: hypothetical protein FWC39_08585 [Bacteroidetes bacterium]|nr:hypothetical protein [Bacteroidota bacterium]